MPRLLITGAGGPAGVALGKQLAGGVGSDFGLEWIGVDIVGLDDANFPVTGLVPRADDLATPRACMRRCGVIVPTW